MAETCMYWRHMAPSAPDTLWSYPFPDKDPFIIEKTPHVYFIGNQPEFEDSLLVGKVYIHIYEDMYTYISIQVLMVKRQELFWYHLLQRLVLWYLSILKP